MTSNVWADAWEPGEDWSGGGGRSRRLSRGTELRHGLLADVVAQAAYPPMALLTWRSGVNG